MKVRSFICLVLFAFAFAPLSGFAQSAEISPYGGYVWTANNNGVGSFKNNQILGVRGGGFVTQSFEVGGNWSWNNHFQPKSANTTAAFAGDLAGCGKTR